MIKPDKILVNNSDNDEIFEAIFPAEGTEIIESNGVIGMVYTPDNMPQKLSKPRDIKITNDGEKKEFKTITRIVISDE